MSDDVSRKVWSLPGRGARLIVDLDVIERNVATICRHVTPGTQVLAVVKAGGYGDGSVQSAQAAIAGGASLLGVATVREGAELRRSGITAPVLVLGPTMAPESDVCRRMNLDIAVGSQDQLDALLRHPAGSQNETLGVHLKIDTGMRRFGVDPDVAVACAHAIEGETGMRLDGIFTHLARADEAAAPTTDQQAVVFRKTLDALRSAGINPGLVHTSNSAATLLRRDLDFDMVRPGICIYGIRPAPGVHLFHGMRPALRVEAAIQRVSEIPAGAEIGYGGTYRCESLTRVGLLSLGYADGYRRAFSQRSWAGFEGTRLPERGRVSMDQTVVELRPEVDIGYGDVVRIAGDGAMGEPTFEQLAELVDTIPYEILTALGQRLPAYYIRSGDVVACNDDTYQI